VKSFALVFLLACLWGASYPLLKVAVETIPPLTVVALRASLGGLILLAAMGRSWRGLRDVARDSPRSLVIQSLFMCVIPWILIAWAVRSLDAGLAAILNSLSPIFIFLITALVTRHEPVSARKGLGVALGIAGVVTIVGIDALSGAGQQTWAEIACVAGALSYAIAGVIGVRFSKVSPLVPAAGSTLLAACVVLPLALAVERPWQASPSLASMLAILAGAVLSTGLAQVVYFRLLSTVGSIAMSAQAYLRIVVGVGLGMLFLGETPTPQAWAGLALVVAGVIAMTLPAVRPPGPPPPGQGPSRAPARRP
jgi:drug/metabolite transporter (DMT)-like permease